MVSILESAALPEQPRLEAPAERQLSCYPSSSVVSDEDSSSHDTHHDSSTFAPALPHSEFLPPQSGPDDDEKPPPLPPKDVHRIKRSHIARNSVHRRTPAQSLSRSPAPTIPRPAFESRPSTPPLYTTSPIQESPDQDSIHESPASERPRTPPLRHSSSGSGYASEPQTESPHSFLSETFSTTSLHLQLLQVGVQSSPPLPGTRRRAASERGDGHYNLTEPPPGLIRPTTFWKNSPKTALCTADYSPSTHLVRRSTFVAAAIKQGGGKSKSLYLPSSSENMYMLFAACFLLVSGSIFAGVVARPVAQQEAMSSTFDWWPYPDFTQTATFSLGQSANRTTHSSEELRSTPPIGDSQREPLLATGSSTSSIVVTTSGALIKSQPGNQPLYVIILAAVGGIGFGMLFSFILFRHRRSYAQLHGHDPQPKTPVVPPDSVCQTRASVVSCTQKESDPSFDSPTIAYYRPKNTQPRPSSTISQDNSIYSSSDVDTPLTVTMSEQPIEQRIEYPSRAISHAGRQRYVATRTILNGSFPYDRNDQGVATDASLEIRAILNAHKNANRAEWSRLKRFRDIEYKREELLTYRSPRPGRTGLGITIPPKFDASASSMTSKFDTRGRIALSGEQPHPRYL